MGYIQMFDVSIIILDGEIVSGEHPHFGWLDPYLCWLNQLNPIVACQILIFNGSISVG